MSNELYNYYRVNKVSSDERFNLQIKLNRCGNKKARVLMMNPSNANNIVSDPTTNLVISKISHETEQYTEIEIINISPKITPQPVNLLELDNEEEKYNIHYLYKKMSDKNYDLFFGTGDFFKHSPQNVKKQMRRMYQAVLDHLYPIRNQYNMFTYGLTKKIYGKHISRGEANLSQFKKPVTIGYNNRSNVDTYYLKEL